MRVSCAVCTIPKRGSAPKENEDAVWPKWIHKAIPIQRTFRCAVTDGATQASFSSLWARLLARQVTRQPITTQRLQWAVERSRVRWRGEIETRSLSWAALEKLQSGAFATLVGLELFPASHDAELIRRWEVVAIGDACLVHFRNSVLQDSYPVSDPDEFGNAPLALASDPRRNLDTWAQAARFTKSGVWEPHDVFLLLTDAIAQWLLREHKLGTNPLSQLESLIQSNNDLPNSYAEWVATLRDEGKLRDDDATVAWIRPEE